MVGFQVYLTEEQERGLEAVRGMWADRDDVADLHERLGQEWEERLKRVWGRSL
jgi:hypothetical protein